VSYGTQPCVENRTYSLVNFSGLRCRSSATLDVRAPAATGEPHSEVTTASVLSSGAAVG
jgi:hypothetical protein